MLAVSASCHTILYFQILLNSCYTKQLFVVLYMSEKAMIISYYDNETNQGTLTGLTPEERKVFTDIVQKQFENGIKIKIRYEEVDIPN